MSVSVTFLQRRRDPDDSQVQQATADIDGVRCRFDEVPVAATTSQALETWLRRTYTDEELAALAEAQADIDAAEAPPQYLVLRWDDLGPPILQTVMTVFLARLNAVEVSAGISPTTPDIFLDASLRAARGS